MTTRTSAARLLLIAVLTVSAATGCGDDGESDQPSRTPTEAPVDVPDENEPDENEPDENEPDENEPDENEPDENDRGD